MLSESEVTERMANHLRQKHSEKKIEKGEKDCTGSANTPTDWKADIVVGSLMYDLNSDQPEYDLCVECKGRNEYRKGIGQAISFALFNEQAGFACYDAPQAIRDMVDISPIHGWSVTEEGVEHYSTPETIEDL